MIFTFFYFFRRHFEILYELWFSFMAVRRGIGIMITEYRARIPIILQITERARRIFQSKFRSRIVFPKVSSH